MATPEASLDGKIAPPMQQSERGFLHNVKVIGRNIGTAIAMAIASAGTVDAQEKKEPDPLPLTKKEVQHLVHKLGVTHYHDRDRADKKLRERLDYPSLLLLAPYAEDPDLERKRRVKAILAHTSPTIFEKNFPIPTDVDQYWLYQESQRSFRYTQPNGCTLDVYKIAEQLDMEADVRKADSSDKSDWEDHRLKLRKFIQAADIEQRAAVPIWNSDIKKHWDSYLRTNPKGDKDTWNKQRIDSHMKLITEDTKTRVQFFRNESDLWRVRNNHKPKQEKFVPFEERPDPFYPGWPPHFPPGPGLRFREQKHNKEEARLSPERSPL